MSSIVGYLQSILAPSISTTVDDTRGMESVPAQTTDVECTGSVGSGPGSSFDTGLLHDYHRLTLTPAVAADVDEIELNGSILGPPSPTRADSGSVTAEDEHDTEDEEELDEFKGTGQITNMVEGMPDGLVDGQYLFNQLKFFKYGFYLHDRVWIKAVKSNDSLDWRIVEMKLDKDQLQQEVEARQKYTKTYRKVNSASPTEIRLEPLETPHGVAVQVIRNTVAEVTLIPGDWLEVRTEQTKGGAESYHKIGKIFATLFDRQEYKGKVSKVVTDEGSAVIDGCYYVPPCVWGSLEIKVGSPVRAVVFKSDQGEYMFRAGTIVEDASALTSIEVDRVNELCRDKRGITTQPSMYLDFGELKVGSKKDRTFTIINESQRYMHVLRDVMVQEAQTVAKFSLRVTRESEEIVGVFSPDECKTVEVKVTCEPVLVGETTDFCMFNFGDFQIFKELRVKVVPNATSLLKTLTTNRMSLHAHRRKFATDQTDLERKHEPFTVSKVLVWAGISLVRRPFFKAQVEKPKPYSIPGSVEEAVKTRDAGKLFEAFPTMSATKGELEYTKVRKLTPENYGDMFHVALWMEELHHLKRRQAYNLEDVTFSKSGDAYFFEFPQLGDVYPKFRVSDPIRFVDRADSNGRIYKANISRLGNCHIFLDLKEDVFQNYDGRPLCVEFLLGRHSYKRCHHAVDKVLENFGIDWLFPTEVTCVNPRIRFVERGIGLPRNENEDDEEDDEGVSLLYQKRLPQPRRARRFGVPVARRGKRAANVFPVQPQSIGTVDPETAAGLKMELKWINKSLNDEQKAAVRMILRGDARPCPYIIFGPPGTGKTETVVEAVIQIAKLDPNARLLICGPSNASVNQICKYLIERGKFSTGEFIRFVGYYREDNMIPEWLKDYCLDGDQIQSVYNHKIILCTCNTAAQFSEAYGLMADRFTHLFIDEAGYCHEPDSLIPISLLSKNTEPPQMILAGDPNQLGPVLFDDYSSFYGLKTSFLERVMDSELYKRDENFQFPPHLITKLIRSYRCHPDLLTVPSRLFYDSELIPASLENLGELADRLEFLPMKGTPLVFHGVRGDQSKDSDSPSWYNPTEVIQVIEYVKKLLNNHCVPDDIGIISPYRKQVEKIKEALTSEVKCRPIKVGSVEEFQGGERNVIILSLVRSLNVDDNVLTALSFAFSPKRFNVSLTRAKSLLIAVGNPYVFAQEYVWRQFLKYAIEKEVYIGCDLPPILRSYAEKCDKKRFPAQTEERHGLQRDSLIKGCQGDTSDEDSSWD